MRKFLLYLSLVCLGLPSAFSQVTKLHPSREEFQLAVKDFIANQTSIRQAINAVKPEELQISYASGKSFDDEKEVALSTLTLAALWANRIQVEPGLSGEISFMVAVQELRGQLEELSTRVLSFDPANNADVNKALMWSDALQKVAHGEVSKLEQTSFFYTTQHAQEIDGNPCPDAKHRPGQRN